MNPLELFELVIKTLNSTERKRINYYADPISVLYILNDDVRRACFRFEKKTGNLISFSVECDICENEEAGREDW